MKNTEAAMWGLVILVFAVSIYLYPYMPESMASHWNAHGEVDRYAPRAWGVFFIPFVITASVLIFNIVLRVDPLKENIKNSQRHNDKFVILFIAFMVSVYAQIILWNLEIKISPKVTAPISIGILFFYIGILCENAKRNWFIGIRTPWTLRSERVWNKTHKIGGKLFKITGIIALCGVFFPKHTLFFILIPVFLVAAYVSGYSYFEYRRERR